MRNEHGARSRGYGARSMVQDFVNNMFLLLDKEEYPDEGGGRWFVAVARSKE